MQNKGKVNKDMGDSMMRIQKKLDDIQSHRRQESETIYETSIEHKEMKELLNKELSQADKYLLSDKKFEDCSYE